MAVRHVRFQHRKPYIRLGIDPSPRPYVSCALAANGKYVNILALVDSGADGCRFPLAIGEELGFDFTTGSPEMSSGFGGMGFAYRRTIELTFARHTFPIEARFDSYAADWQAVIGRQGFFAQFFIGFEETQRAVSFRAL